MDGGYRFDSACSFSHLLIGQMRRAEALVEDQLILLMLPDSPFNIERKPSPQPLPNHHDGS